MAIFCISLSATDSRSRWSRMCSSSEPGAENKRWVWAKKNGVKIRAEFEGKWTRCFAVLPQLWHVFLYVYKYIFVYLFVLLEYFCAFRCLFAGLPPPSPPRCEPRPCWGASQALPILSSWADPPDWWGKVWNETFKIEIYIFWWGKGADWGEEKAGGNFSGQQGGKQRLTKVQQQFKL